MAERSTGLTCPDCGSNALRVQQVVHKQGAIVRRRRCPKGHCTVTVERFASYEEYNEVQRQIQRARARRNASGVTAFDDQTKRG